jgi:hypothetical protein
MFRYTIRDVVWLTVLAAVLMAWWVEQPSRRPSLSWFRKPLIPKVYYVEDLVSLQSSPQRGGVAMFDGLINEIKASVTEDDWASAGGIATISGWETNMSLVIHHSDEGHAMTAKYLADKRARQPAGRGFRDNRVLSP